MNTTPNIVLLGTKNSVVAFERKDGRMTWTTRLPSGGIGGEFVSLHADGIQVFAYAGGQLSCLELTTGRILWTNPLKGLGYGMATLTTPGAGSDQTTLHAMRRSHAGGAG